MAQNRRFFSVALNAAQPLWKDRSARIVHSLLCAVIVLMGISGVAVVAVSEAGPVLASGHGTLPLFSVLAPFRVHLIGAIVLVALISVHVAVALHHQFLIRDNLLSRMGLSKPRSD
jgi:cytochrome b561